MTQKRKKGEEKAGEEEAGEEEAVEVNPQQTKKHKETSQSAIDPEKIEVVPEITETFADPTLDVTFKMLFGNDLHKEYIN